MSQRRVKLDRIDLKILRDLQDSGRMTNVELARRAGISAPPCLRRVRALEEAGYAYDLLLLGFEMPRASGLDVLSAVRSINSSMRVILFGEEAEQAIVASEYGATAFVQTPTSPAEVTRLMQRLRPRAAELASV